MRKCLPLVGSLAIAATAAAAAPNGNALLREHCADCHNPDKAKGKFQLGHLGDAPDAGSAERWVDALDLVTAGEMPPEDESTLSATDRAALVTYLEAQLHAHAAASTETRRTTPRRLNNREFANAVADVLLIEDIGTHQPADNLPGDTLHHGFDTHGDSLGFSRFHLEQYIGAVRKIVDATVLEGDRPAPRHLVVPAEKIRRQQLSQNTNRPVQYGAGGRFDFLDPKLAARLEGFLETPATGHYTITVHAAAVDHGIYDSDLTGFYHGDPVQLAVHLGDRVRTFDLPHDGSPATFQLDGWIAAGTRLELRNPTDAFTFNSNGNFKFQYRIAADHARRTDPDRYAALVREIEANPTNRRRDARHWSNLVPYWQGARPRLFKVEIDGPHYESWPPRRQVALLGENPSAADARSLLAPVAERAWRRPPATAELDRLATLVENQAATLGDVGALKEGIVAVLVSPAFLLNVTDDATGHQRFATKFSLALEGTIPPPARLAAVRAGDLDTFDAVRTEFLRMVDDGELDSFLREFPTAWLELDDINFMAPDPDHYRFYHRKRLAEDMVAEVLRFFRHAVENNLPAPELLAADYSFINADLAKVYGVDGIPEDSTLRKYTFTDGRRGGLLGMGAFLTATADSLATSPIHRAIYVMENFMGIHPTPPPPDVEISEPDVRQAKTIKEVLAAHSADSTCANCHKAIDPWGYAFENFDPTGAWRDHYTVLDPAAGKEKRRPAQLPIDAAATFRNGTRYGDIRGFRESLLTEANRDRFVRCFIAKFLTFANGTAPGTADFVAVDRVLATSAANGYRIVDTLAAAIDSPLFREETDSP